MIDETGAQLGIVSLEKALYLARERNLDLIQVTEKVVPPVCKIGDYGKHLYREEKKGRAGRKHKGGGLKIIKLSFKISPHDLETKARQSEKFLAKGDRVRIELPLRGREKALPEFGRQKIEKFIEILKNNIPINIEREIKREPHGFSTLISKS